MDFSSADHLIPPHALEQANANYRCAQFEKPTGRESELSEELAGGSFVSLFANPQTESERRPIEGLIFSRLGQGMAALRSGQWKFLAEVNPK